ATHRVAFVGVSRNILWRAPAIHARGSADEGPDVSVKRSELALHIEESLRVLNRRRDLQTITHNASVSQQSGDLPCAIAGDFRSVELVEGATIIFAFVEDGAPAQTRLGAFEDQ